MSDDNVHLIEDYHLQSVNKNLSPSFQRKIVCNDFFLSFYSIPL